ncbi:MAG: ABC-F family ATP-binding cassette domain-containing protein [Candidatus Gracilibacteria bacterium]|jgi:ATP-binding cassette subfamily F protein 3
MLIAKDLSFDAPSGQLFEGINVSLDSASKKRVAIVGRNGCGKSTLLRLLKGELEPTRGSVSSSQEFIGYLPQDIVFQNEEELVGAYLESKLEETWMTYKIDIALEEVGLPPESILLPLKTLSGGQRVRVALATLLLADPTILLLDEPTNHLDTAGIEWLKSFVSAFRGTVAFVSHDRSFINAVADQIWEISAEHNIEVYSCSYNRFLIERYERYQKRLELYNLSQREVTELEEWLAENANHPKYKFTATVAQKKKALERLDKKAPPMPIPDPRVKMRPLEAGQKGTVLNAFIESKSYEDRKILQNIRLKMEQGERILIEGPNGCGKSTLLNILSGEDKDFTGSVTLRANLKIGYLGQFSRLNPDKTVIEEFGASTHIEYTAGRSTLAAFLFPAEFMDSKIKSLSYGQKRRLEFAIMLTNKPDLLLLDEPTNHLDLFLREDLEHFLLEQNIAMCIISHDTHFVKKLGITKILRLQS